MNIWREVFTLDNLLHSLVAVAFTSISLGLLAVGASPGGAAFGLAGGAGVGLYLREAAQVDWDFTLKSSLHKHMEWLVGTVAGFAAAGVIAVATA